jgi:hypothetical protein
MPKSTHPRPYSKITTIPHNGWAFITIHKSGSKFLYVGKTEIEMSEILKFQNPDTIMSISKLDVNMVTIYE